MLLWVLVLALFGAAVALLSPNMPEDLRANTLAVQSWISAAFLLFILLTSNPFARMANPPIEGNDLNPLLQDPVSPSIRRCSISAMSDSRSSIPSRRRR